uniref:Uncharacterized protein n=1 Tax=Caenorhabditis tropicalis TaxID=1561998 RepID=A0A1I7U107_9PELO
MSLPCSSNSESSVTSSESSPIDQQIKINNVAFCEQSDGASSSAANSTILQQEASSESRNLTRPKAHITVFIDAENRTQLRRNTEFMLNGVAVPFEFDFTFPEKRRTKTKEI